MIFIGRKATIIYGNGLKMIETQATNESVMNRKTIKALQSGDPLNVKNFMIPNHHICSCREHS